MIQQNRSHARGARRRDRVYRGLAAAFVGSALCAAAALPGQDSGELFEQTFDAHWERLRDPPIHRTA